MNRLVGHTAVQALTATRDVLEKVIEIRLEIGEDLIGVVLGTDAHLALAGHGIVDDLLGALLGEAHDLLLAGKMLGLTLCVLEDAIGINLCGLDHALTVTNDDASLTQLLWEDIANLIKNLKNGANFDLALLAIAQDRLGLLDALGKLVEELLDTCVVQVGTPLPISFYI